jgi:5-methyltetrahydropteroyltriglutamate--homocysteine methyltransferase
MIATNNGSFPWRGSQAGDDLEKALSARAGAAPEDLRPLMDRVTREAIDAQVLAGLDMVTDGLVRREDPIGYVAEGLQGYSPGEKYAPYPGHRRPCRVPVAHSEVGWKEPILVEDYLFAREGMATPVKVVLTGPYTLACFAEDRAYGDRMALATSTAAALNQELRALQAVGVSFIQVDEPALLEHAEDFPTFTRIWEVLGRGLSATLCLHLEGGALGDLYPGVLRLKRLGCLSLDCVAGKDGLGVFSTASLPESMRLGLGIVDGGSERIESPEALADLVRGIRGLPPHDRLVLGTASGLGDLPVQVAAAKLRSLVRAARLLERG